MPSHRNCCNDKIKLGYPTTHQKRKQLSGYKINTSKNESDISFALRSINSNSKKFSVNGKMNQMSFTSSATQNTSSILTLSPSQITILHLLMLLIIRIRLKKLSQPSASILNAFSGVAETLPCVHVSVSKNKINNKSVETRNTLADGKKSELFTSD